MVKTLSRGFGSPGKYIQGPAEFQNIEEYTDKIGKKVCFLIDGFLYEKIKEKLDGVYEGTESSFIAISFQGECCEKEIERIAEQARKNDSELLAGVGGGKTIDTAKLCSLSLDLPYIVVPTSVSTDAPASEIAVLYTEDGVYVGSRKMKKGAELILVDTDIVLSAPKRLFIAGIGDALSTYLETRSCVNSDTPNYVGAGYKRCLAGIAISKMCFDVLFKDALDAVRSFDAGVSTEAFENIVEANTLLSGLGFHNTGLSVAHGIHSGLTAVKESHKYLHGEKVAFGIVCQLVLERYAKDEVDKIMNLMVDLGLPVTLKEIGVELTEENISKFAKMTFENALIHHAPFYVTEKSIRNSIIAADSLGKAYRNNRRQK